MSTCPTELVPLDSFRRLFCISVLNQVNVVHPVCVLFRETNLKFKFGRKVTDERLQEESQLAGYDGTYAALLREL